MLNRHQEYMGMVQLVTGHLEGLTSQSGSALEEGCGEA